MIIHVSVRPPKITRSTRRTSRSFTVDVRSVSIGSRHTLRRHIDQSRPLSQPISTAWIHENANHQPRRWTHDQLVKRRESLFDPSVQSMAKKNKNDKSRSNIKDLTEHLKTSRNRKKTCGARCSCPCVLLSLLAGILLGIGLAAGLLALLFKPSTTSTSISTTAATKIFLPSVTLTTVIETTTTTITTGATSSTTTASTTITAITTSVTMTVSETTKTETTSSTTTETTTSCNTPTSTILTYSPGPSPFTYQTYNFTASLTGRGLLEFGFYSQS